MSYEVLLNNLGFSQDPFAFWDADEEDRLQDYFIQPPFFNAVFGEPDRPSASVVFAPRGGGKSALRKMVELSSPASEVACITYAAPPTAGLRLADIDLQYHLKNILILALVGVIGHIVAAGTYPNIKPSSKRILYWLLREHLTSLQQADLRRAILAVRSMSQAAREWWNSAIQIANPIIVTVTAALAIPAPELTLFENDHLDLGPLSEQLAFLAIIAKEAGLRSIYVTIDRVDENDLTGDGNKAFNFISPLLCNLNVLQISGVGFKFFLWDILRDQFRRDGRPDRVKTYDINWKNIQLKEMLAKRLGAYSGGRVESINNLVTFDHDVDLDDLIVFLAHGSPRNVIRMCQEILTQQSEMDWDASSIDRAAFIAGIDVFAAKYCEETVRPQILHDLQKVGKLDFTLLFMYRDVFRIKQQSGLQKIQQWLSHGLVRQIGSLKSETGSRSHHYVVDDPLVAKYVLTPKSVFDFIRENTRLCENCGIVNVRNWEVTSVQECSHCNRDIDSAHASAFA